MLAKLLWMPPSPIRWVRPAIAISIWKLASAGQETKDAFSSYGKSPKTLGNNSWLC